LMAELERLAGPTADPDALANATLAWNAPPPEALERWRAAITAA